MGDMGDPPKSKSLFYLAGARCAVLLWCGGSLSGTGARALWVSSHCLERRKKTVLLFLLLLFCFLCFYLFIFYVSLVVTLACLMWIPIFGETEHTLCLNLSVSPPKV